MSILRVWDEASQSYQEFPAIKGEPGKDGQPGKDGKTPVKGEDYFTEADIAECAEAAASLVDVPTKVSELENDKGYLTDSYEVRWSHYWTSTPPNASWSVSLYRNGVLCDKPVYCNVLYSSNLGMEPSLSSSNTGEFVGTKTWTSKSAYAYRIDCYESEEKGALLCTALMEPAVFDKLNLVNFLYPVGSVYTTSTNSAPSIGGTWELVGKEFKEAQGNGTTTLFTPNADNTDTCTVHYRRAGTTLWLKFIVKTAVALTDSSFALGTANLAALGVSSLAVTTLHQKPCGSENGIAIMNMTAAGALSSIDVNPKSSSATSIAAESTFYWQDTLPIKMEDMLDNACDKFHWKRTA